MPELTVLKCLEHAAGEPKADGVAVLRRCDAAAHSKTGPLARMRDLNLAREESRGGEDMATGPPVMEVHEHSESHVGAEDEDQVADAPLKTPKANVVRRRCR